MIDRLISDYKDILE